MRYDLIDIFYGSGEYLLKFSRFIPPKYPKVEFQVMFLKPQQKQQNKLIKN